MVARSGSGLAGPPRGPAGPRSAAARGAGPGGRRAPPGRDRARLVVVIGQRRVRACRSATASTRRPCAAQRRRMLLAGRRCAGPARLRASTTSGAPFVNACGPPCRPRTRASSACGPRRTGISRTSARSARSCSGEMPRSRAARRNAPSTGSPATRTSPSCSISSAVDASTAARSTLLFAAAADRRAWPRTPQAVLGQRPGLVGGDHRGAAERLDGRQPARDRAPARPCAARRARARS